MVLTRSFRDHIKAKIKSDPEFRQALFQEAVQTLLEGDVDTARTVLRDFINATIGFSALAKATRIPPKSLMRMFGPERQSDRGQFVRSDPRAAEENRRAPGSPRLSGLMAKRCRNSRFLRPNFPVSLAEQLADIAREARQLGARFVYMAQPHGQQPQ